MERRACLYFYERASPDTGLVLDRARADGRESRRIASIAATGFGLSALCIAHQRGFLSGREARQRVERTLEFLLSGTPRMHGFYYHFLDADTGARAPGCELSSVDTTWLLCGVIFARQHFGTGKILELANEIIDTIEWGWMWDAGPALCHGWTPEGGLPPVPLGLLFGTARDVLARDGLRLSSDPARCLERLAAAQARV
ncbi:MAG TPA: hypothetical protein VHA11_07495 [Bryobacteraceae bacterium]|nr:hypothetical protein [Bryobacteraceae bacterium]